MEDLIFYFLSFLTILGALGTIFNRSNIYSALSLIVSMFGIAGLFALMEAHFLAVIQIAIYAGAVMVLVLFVIMLLNTEGRRDGKMAGRLFWLYGSIFGGGLLLIYLPRILDAFSGLLSVKANPLVSLIPGTVENLSIVLYGKHIFAFELASVLMLAALVSAILVGKSKDES